jgi:hypothetical protein
MGLQTMAVVLFGSLYAPSLLSSSTVARFYLLFNFCYIAGMQYKQLKLGEVLRFWFEELSHQQRFSGDAEIDAMITERFL